MDLHFSNTQMAIAEAARRVFAAHASPERVAAIDLEAVRVTLWQAAWRLDIGREASNAVAVAKWQASERGRRMVHATQHVHGGVGADVTYPIHRCFLWGKQIELLLDGPSWHLDRLGSTLAADGLAGNVPTGAR